MIALYKNGQHLLDENREFLLADRDASCFIRWDAPVLKTCDKINYALRVDEDGKRLLALKVVPYDLLLYGCPDNVESLLAYLMDNGYEVKDALCTETIGDRFAAVMAEKYGRRYAEALAMDLLESTAVTAPTGEGVEIPTAADVDEMVECMVNFVADCGLTDEITRDKIAGWLNEVRLVRRDGKIASMARIAPVDEESAKITAVYTRPEHRGKGLARLVVNAVKNEILSSGRRATLNVDKKNPVSYGLYRSLGFTKKFSQGAYRREER